MKLNFANERQKKAYYEKYGVGVLRARIIIEIALGVLVMILFPLLSYQRMGADSVTIAVVVGVICLVSAVIYYFRLRKIYKQIAKELEEEKSSK